jgi:hypothetical protein
LLMQKTLMEFNTNLNVSRLRQCGVRKRIKLDYSGQTRDHVQGACR